MSTKRNVCNVLRRLNTELRDFDATSDVSFEAAVRQNLDGVWVKGQYSEAIDAHWRVTLAGAVIAGDGRDFIGQYRRNSHLLLTVRYSF